MTKITAKKIIWKTICGLLFSSFLLSNCTTKIDANIEEYYSSIDSARMYRYDNNLDKAQIKYLEALNYPAPFLMDLEEIFLFFLECSNCA